MLLVVDMTIRFWISSSERGPLVEFSDGVVDFLAEDCPHPISVMVVLILERGPRSKKQRLVVVVGVVGFVAAILFIYGTREA